MKYRIKDLQFDFPKYFHGDDYLFDSKKQICEHLIEYHSIDTNMSGEQELFDEGKIEECLKSLCMFEWKIEEVEEAMLDRSCRNCKYFNSENYTCEEGGYSEIGNPDKIRSRRNCNAWKENTIIKKLIELKEKKNKISENILSELKKLDNYGGECKCENHKEVKLIYDNGVELGVDIFCLKCGGTILNDEIL